MKLLKFLALAAVAGAVVAAVRSRDEIERYRRISKM